MTNEEFMSDLLARARKAQEKVYTDLDGETFVSYYAQEE